MLDLQEIIKGIAAPDNKMYEKARRYVDSLVKPPNSLGRLEDIAIKLAAITGELRPDFSKRCIIVMAADNGVCAEGISSAPQSVTLMQTLNMARGGSGVAVLARQFGADLMVVDVGIDADVNNPHIINRKIRKSTSNLLHQPAMTRVEALKAVKAGVDCVAEAKRKGYTLLGSGEMGIGNTTTSSAVLSALLGYRGDRVNETIGRGGGLTKEAFIKKQQVIKTALELHNPNSEDVLDVLSKVGGLDIAGLCGVFLGAAYYKLPIVVDGFIAAVAALCAARLNPLVKEYLLASHQSAEPGFLLAADELGLCPVLDMQMRLGEGSGSALMFTIIDGACAMMRMATFAEAAIDDSYLDEIRRERENGS